MSLQPNPSFEDDFGDDFVYVSLEWLWLDREKRVKEGMRERRREKGKESKRKGNSERVIVGRKERERKEKLQKLNNRVCHVYFNLDTKINLVLYFS